MSKIVLLPAVMMLAVSLFAGFTEDCQKVEAWIRKNYSSGTPSYRLQNNRLRQIRQSQGSETQKIEQLRRHFPQAFALSWENELQTAKGQGITFSEDNKTLLKCPPSVTTVVIPSCVTVIGENAFKDCADLISVTIPDSVQMIQNGAFMSCAKLNNVVLPGNLLFIGSSAFFGCQSLTKIEIPDKVTFIGVGAFALVPSVIVSENNQNFMLDDAGALLDMVHNVILYLSPLFRGHYEIPDGITVVGSGAFFCCGGLSSVKIPETVTAVGDMAFSGCGSLTSVTIPSAVVSIGEKAFYRTGLRSATITHGVTIGSEAFPGGCQITRVVLDSLAVNLRAAKEQGITFSEDNKTLLKCPGNITFVVIPSCVTVIGENAFKGCTALTSVVIPDSVTSIGNSAFYGCSGLTSITIPDSVTSIGNLAFSGCSGLTSVVIPSSVKSIGGEAFTRCSRLTSITISEGVTSIGGRAFYGCSRLTSVVIPSSVTSIGASAFSGCSRLTSITIPDSVTSIGDYAFYCCFGLTSITIPKDCSVGFCAFPDGCRVIRR